MNQPKMGINCALATLLAILFCACQKKDLSPADQVIGAPNLSTRVSSWLSAQKENIQTATIVQQTNSKEKDNSGAAVRNANIDLLMENLNYNAAYQTSFTNRLNYLVIPINDKVKSKKRVDEKASLHLAMITDNLGKIKSAHIICFLPLDGKDRGTISPTLIANLLTGKPTKDSCMLRVLSITGRWLHQTVFANNRVVSYGAVTSKKPENSVAVNGICIDWWLVTTIHGLDGSTQEIREYVGQTCSSDCNDPNYQSLCPVDAGGGSSESGEIVLTINENAVMSESSESPGQYEPDLSGYTSNAAYEYYPSIFWKYNATVVGAIHYGTNEKIITNVGIAPAEFQPVSDVFVDKYNIAGTVTRVATYREKNYMILTPPNSVYIWWRTVMQSTFISEYMGRTWILPWTNNMAKVFWI
ncbi:MAG: hypothetical protein EPO58_08290 [Chitinophagaceae bacterium]|nr:MAG: hypothetical protein EPO58_08290 [Chitinophagaceae bacterium]